MYIFNLFILGLIGNSLITMLGFIAMAFVLPVRLITIPFYFIKHGPDLVEKAIREYEKANKPKIYQSKTFEHKSSSSFWSTVGWFFFGLLSIPLIVLDVVIKGVYRILESPVRGVKNGVEHKSSLEDMCKKLKKNFLTVFNTATINFEDNFDSQPENTACLEGKEREPVLDITSDAAVKLENEKAVKSTEILHNKNEKIPMDSNTPKIDQDELKQKDPKEDKLKAEENSLDKCTLKVVYPSDATISSTLFSPEPGKQNITSSPRDNLSL